MRAVRLAGSRSARNCAASWAVGRVPMTSRKARRRNTASEERLAGWVSRGLGGAKERGEGGGEECGGEREIGGLDVEAFEAVEDAGVDGGLGGQGSGTLKGWIEGALGTGTGGGDGQEDRE